MAHPHTIIIESMARTLLVTAYADERERSQEYDTGSVEDAAWAAAWRELPSASMGADWMDVTPAGTADVQRRALIEAAVLYGRIAQAWGAEPWICVHHHARQKAGYTDVNASEQEDIDTECQEEWGHYAVMSALGHGVCWEDSNKPLTRWGPDGDVTLRVGGVVHIESLDVSPADFADEDNG